MRCLIRRCSRFYTLQSINGIFLMKKAAIENVIGVTYLRKRPILRYYMCGCDPTFTSSCSLPNMEILSVLPYQLLSISRHLL